MRHHAHSKTLYTSNGYPSKLACLDSIPIEEGKWVCKDKRGGLKAHAVFSQIGFRFDRIPFKAQSHAFMLLQICISKLLPTSNLLHALHFTHTRQAAQAENHAVQVAQVFGVHDKLDDGLAVVGIPRLDRTNVGVVV